MIRFIFIFLLGFISYGQGIVANPYVTFGVSCVVDPNEQLTAANAASDPVCNEADAITGYGSGSGGVNTSQSVEVHDGSWAIKNTSPDGVISYANVSIPGSGSGDEFTVTVWVKSTQGSNPRITAWQNVSSGGPSSVSVTSSWVEHTFNITASGAVTMRYYSAATGGDDPDDNIFIDNLSVIKTN